MAAECDDLKEDIRELKTDIRAVRDRLHKSENNIASSAALLGETTTNLNWVMSELEKFNELKDKIESLRLDFAYEKESKLKEQLSNQTTKIKKFWDAIFSFKFFSTISIVIFVIAYVSDKISLAHHIDQIRRAAGG